MHHLANFILLSKHDKESEDGPGENKTAKRLEQISLKFECTLYHKLYKEEILKILLKNASIIKNHTKLRDITIFETVLSNKDFFYLGQIIEYIPSIKSISI